MEEIWRKSCLPVGSSNIFQFGPGYYVNLNKNQPIMQRRHRNRTCIVHISKIMAFLITAGLNISSSVFIKKTRRSFIERYLEICAKHTHTRVPYTRTRRYLYSGEDNCAKCRFFELPCFKVVSWLGSHYFTARTLLHLPLRYVL